MSTTSTIAMPAPTGTAKRPQNVQKEDAMWLQKELINRNYAELAGARAANRKVSATFVPGNLNELLMCFDLAYSPLRRQTTEDDRQERPAAPISSCCSSPWPPRPPSGPPSC